MESIVKQCTSSEEQKTRILKTRAIPKDFASYKKALEVFSKFCYNLGQVMTTQFPYPYPPLLSRGTLFRKLNFKAHGYHCDSECEMKFHP